MKKPSFDKYVQNRDQQENLDEGWFDSQDVKNRNAANDAITKALPTFLKAMEKLGSYATPEHAAKMGRYIVQLGQGDTNNFLNKEVATASGGKASVAQFLKQISTKFQQDLFHGTAFKNYEEYKKALDAVTAVKEQHKLAYQRFTKNMQGLAGALKKQVATDHGPDATKKPGEPALDTKGQANVGAQRQGLASKLGSGIGRMFGLGNR